MPDVGVLSQQPDFRRKRAISHALADLALHLAPDQPVQGTREDPRRYPLVALRRSARKLMIHLLNTSGADLPEGAPTPAPPRVLWKSPVALTLTFKKPVRRIQVISLDTEDNRILDRLGKVASLKAPAYRGAGGGLVDRWPSRGRLFGTALQKVPIPLVKRGTKVV